MFDETTAYSSVITAPDKYKVQNDLETLVTQNCDKLFYFVNVVFSHRRSSSTAVIIHDVDNRNDNCPVFDETTVYSSVITAQDKYVVQNDLETLVPQNCDKLFIL